LILKVYVYPLPYTRGEAIVRIGMRHLRCHIGRSGTRFSKREGDGATPYGTYRVLGGFYRQDRLPRPRSGVLLRAVTRNDLWCDDPKDRRYNRPVKAPFAPSHEELWRADHVYDIVLDLSYNRAPILKGHGSAIFMHIANAQPTAGCLAFSLPRLQVLLREFNQRTRITVKAV
jgi:L,D-peptidoglycan transpeptidase YkuD (ErfK/YbiS/YcfS/YnhG family)